MASAQSGTTPQARTFAQFLMTVEDDFDSSIQTAQDENVQPVEVEVGNDRPNNLVADQETSDFEELPASEPTPSRRSSSETTGSSLSREPTDGFSSSGNPTATPELTANEPPLSLADVVASLYRSYPEINRARIEGQVASGNLTSAYGSYDTKFQAFSLTEPTGFYRNSRNGLGVARQTWWGGYVSAGYRIGRGYYQPWYKERQTDDAGEFKVAFNQALLQGRAIDAERVAVFQARLAQQAVGPLVQQSILEISREATAAYWEWVATGAFLEAQRELLELAELRGEQYEAGVKAGKFAEIDLILNQQLIAERRTKQLESEQKFQATSFKLSLYLRDDAGRPLVPSAQWLPKQFPQIVAPEPMDFEAEFALALARRPEPQVLQYEVRQVDLERQLACNQMLPRLDFISEASQDMGEPATKADDKGEFELVIGFQSEVPIQRRKARGKLQSTAGKIQQINEKIRLVRNKIGAEIQVQNNSLQLATQIVRQSELSLQAALETLDRYRFAFERGKIDLIYLNLLETKVNETEIKLVEAQQTWFTSLAALQIALGIDPLEQAMTVSSLPPSDLPQAGSAGDRPTGQEPEPPENSDQPEDQDPEEDA
ncbi:Outer membrane efflux protein [Rubripirellula amarantea]|uniref:Outer membrane efflux protein n=1 Tax=Rubripirellula amarantea TaxID=2527999 RepID=A0A5C5WFF2_9BACT|nr:TolC family protein [Rubripirellula amarantea]TWT49586.1 Outer membrane efflux protein [Rubripirellula amarantea]